MYNVHSMLIKILIRKKKNFLFDGVCDHLYFLRKVQWFPKFWGNNEKNALRV